MTEEFKVGQKVRSKQEPEFQNPKTIEHIAGNVAMVQDRWGTFKLIKLVDLVSAEPPKEEPFKPGWFKIRHKPASNFLYYVQAEIAGNFYYTHAYNPVTGQMDGPASGVGFPVLISGRALNVARGDLIRMKFVEE